MQILAACFGPQCECPVLNRRGRLTPTSGPTTNLLSFHDSSVTRTTYGGPVESMLPNTLLAYMGPYHRDFEIRSHAGTHLEFELTTLLYTIVSFRQKNTSHYDYLACTNRNCAGRVCYSSAAFKKRYHCFVVGEMLS